MDTHHFEGLALMLTRGRPDPYCAFNDDKNRLLALISRDIRYVIIGWLSITASSHVPWMMVMRIVGIAA